MIRPVFLLPMAFWLLALAVPAFAKDLSSGEKKIQSLNDQIVAANERKDLPAALKAAEEAVQVAKTEFGEDSLAAADTMNSLASLYLHIKRAPEAEKLYRQSLRIYLEKTDKEGLDMAASYFNLGVAYAMQRKYEKALNILNKALIIRLKKLGPEDEATKNVEQMIAELEKLNASNVGKI